MLTADGVFEFNPEATERQILMAAKWFVDLGNNTSAEVRTFGLWYALMNPGALTEDTIDAFRGAGAGDFYQQLQIAF